MENKIRRHALIWFSGHSWRMRAVFWGGALAVGLVSVAFTWAANEAQAVFRGLPYNPWMPLALTPAGFMFCAWVTRAMVPGAQGSGIPQAIAGRTLRDAESRTKLLSLKLIAGKILLTLVGLCCGASIGREGPTVQVGASLMLQVARFGGMGRERGLILAGSAAGVAAAFNTPLAGIVFAIEEMSRAFEQRTNGLVLTAVILAGLASLGLVGNYSYFGSTNSMLHVTIDWVAVVVCGVLGGLFGSLFAWSVLKGTHFIARLAAPAPMRRALLLAGCCGLLVALCGLLSHGDTYGTGYEAARSLIEGRNVEWQFTPLKFIATTASSLSGIPGGLFSPSLAVGAGLGGLVAKLLGAHAVSAIVLLGMAAYFSGVVQAPMTSFVIIGEMSNANGMVIPLMIAAFIAYGVARVLQGESLYHALADRFIAETAHATGAKAKH